jgi:hypothetical protein
LFAWSNLSLAGSLQFFAHFLNMCKFCFNFFPVFLGSHSYLHVLNVWRICAKVHNHFSQPSVNGTVERLSYKPFSCG